MDKFLGPDVRSGMIAAMSEDMPVSVKLSQREYLERLRELHLSELPAEQTRVLEFLLTIDYRLGKDLSDEKRQALLVVIREVCSERDLLITALQKRGVPPATYAEQLNKLLHDYTDSVRRILDAGEVEVFLGVKAGETPSISIDLDKIRM